MALEPEIRSTLELLNGLAPMHSLTVDQLRTNMRAGLTEPTLTSVTTRDFTIDGPAGEIRMRHYLPKGLVSPRLGVFIHGGGFVMGDLDTHDHMCREIAIAAGCALVSVDYRLAPEHRYPAAVDDTLAAIRWAAASAKELGSASGGLIVIGDSAGGNIAAAAALSLRDTNEPLLCGQVLIYPVADHYDARRPSYEENGQGYYLTSRDMVAFWDHYLKDPAQAQEAGVSPVRAASLKGVAPAFVLTAEYDPLRDEGEALGRRLDEETEGSDWRRYDGVIHGFVRFSHISPTGRRAIADIGDWIRRRFVAAATTDAG